MPRKTIALGSPQFEYDFSNDTSPFENGVGYAIGTWLGTGDKVAAAREQKQQDDLKNQLTRARISHLNRTPATHAPYSLTGRVAPGHLVRSLTTVRQGVDLLGRPTNDAAKTVKWLDTPRPDAKRQLLRAGIDPDTLRFLDAPVDTPDESAPPGKKALEIPPPGPTQPDINQGFLTLRESGSNLAPRTMGDWTGTRAGLSRIGSYLGGGSSTAAAPASEDGTASPFDGSPGAVQGDEFSMGDQQPDEAPPAVTAAAPVAPADLSDEVHHADAIAELVRAGNGRDAANWIAQMKAEKGPAGDEFAARVKARVRALLGTANAAP